MFFKRFLSMAAVCTYVLRLTDGGLLAIVYRPRSAECGGKEKFPWDVEISTAVLMNKV